MGDLTVDRLVRASYEGFLEEEKEEEGATKGLKDVKRELLGDAELLSEDQVASLFLLKEPNKYTVMKLKRVSLSFSGASVFFFTPYRPDGTPMPASVLKFDQKECVEDEIAKTEKYRSLFGSTTPEVKDSVLLEKEGPCSIMQIDLCGGVFGLPEFAKAPPVQTFASILEQELENPTHSVEVVPIINEALERRMYHFTMSQRKIKSLCLAETYKLVRFVGHGILNRAKEGAKRGAKSPALAQGFQQPVEIDDLDPEGRIIKELCGRKQTVRALFQSFADMEKTFKESLQRNVVVGLAHNDLHGGNLLVDSQGLVWLIDFATVKEDQHVLMDLTKFLSACTFMYLQQKVHEPHIEALAKILAVTPDATTEMPLAYLNEVQEDPIAVYFFRIVSRIRFCMSIYESGPGAPANDGTPFAVALMSWSTRMLSYSEPNLFQKTRALYWSVACMQRLLVEVKQDPGARASAWIEEQRGLWEGQKGRRLSSSVATDHQAVAAYEFELELPAYLSQAGASEAWSSDILTREKVNVSETCVPLTMEFDGRLNTRRLVVSPEGLELIECVRPTFQVFAPSIMEKEGGFYGRTLVVGDAGTGKSVLTRQIFAALAQDQVKEVQKLASLPQVKDDQGRVVPPKLQQAFLPLRVPLVDLSRQMEAMNLSLDEVPPVDLLNDLLCTWVVQKYGQDSNLLMLVQDVRAAAQESRSDGLPNMALVLLLDGLDEASTRRMALIEYLSQLLAEEPKHLPMLTSRPGVLAKKETNLLGDLGFLSVGLTSLTADQAATIAERSLQRTGEEEKKVSWILSVVRNPAYANLIGNPLCLCLLTNVLRKMSGETTKVIGKVELYKRAFRLMLHQSDAAKFMSRDGAADRDIIRDIEMAKGSDARRFYQHISWQAHCWRRRTLTLEDFGEVCGNKDLLESLVALVKEARLPVFQNVSNKEFQLAHLSFQEVLAAEFVSNVLRFGWQQGQLRPFANFMTSSEAQTLGRDRLSIQWWQAVWLVVGDMLSPDEFSGWCSVLADDRSMKLLPGKIVTVTYYNAYREQIDRFRRFSKRRKELHELHPETKTFCWHEVSWVDQKSQSAQLKIPEWTDWITDYFNVNRLWLADLKFSFPVPLSYLKFSANGVNILMAEAAKFNQIPLVKQLVVRGIHYGVMNTQELTPLDQTLQSGDYHITEWLCDREVCFDCLRNDSDMRMQYRYQFARARYVQRPFASCFQLTQIKRKLSGALKAAYEGTLQPTNELDANLLEPRTGVTVLMLAAAGGHAQLVQRLLRLRALVNARTSELATPLSFAVENTDDDATGADVMRILLDAKADVNAKSGVTYDYYKATHMLGNKNPVGYGAVYMKHVKKLDTLLEYGYDLKETNEYGVSAIFHAGMFYQKDTEVDQEILRRCEAAGLKTSDIVDEEKVREVGVSRRSFVGNFVGPFPNQWRRQIAQNCNIAVSKGFLVKSVEDGLDICEPCQVVVRAERHLAKTEELNFAPAFIAIFADPLVLKGNASFLRQLVSLGFDFTTVATSTKLGPIVINITYYQWIVILCSKHMPAEIYHQLWDLVDEKKPFKAKPMTEFPLPIVKTGSWYASTQDWWDAKVA